MERRARAGERDDVDAGDADGAGGGQDAGGADADGGGLAGAVGAEQAVEFALADAEVDAIDGRHALLAAVDLTQPQDFDDRFTHAWALSTARL